MKTLKEQKVIVNLDGKSYDVVVHYRRVKGFTLYGKRNDEFSFSFSCPAGASQEKMTEVLTSLLIRHLGKREKRKKLETPVSEGDTYVLGEKKSLSLSPEEEKAYLKKLGLPLVKERVAHYEAIMGVKKPYKVRVRDMETRFGTNSRKTHRLTFATNIFHYPLEVIDSVVVHELAHDFVFNHSKAFYKVVYKHCPDYDRLTKRLKRKQYEREDN